MIDGDPADEARIVICPHGYEAEHDRCGMLGFRSHDTWSKHPICGGRS